MSVAPRPVFVSSLPGAPKLSDVTTERRHEDGRRCGCSTYVIPSGRQHDHLKPGDRVEIGHIVSGLPWPTHKKLDEIPSESVFEKQSIHIVAAVNGAPVGRLTLYRYDKADHKHAAHFHVWSAHMVEVDTPWERAGIASALYAHAKEFGYLLGPGHGLIGRGRAMWTRLDPTIKIQGRSPVDQNPRIDVPDDDRSETTLRRLWHRHRRHAPLEEIWEVDRERVLEDPDLMELADQAVSAAKGLFDDLDEDDFRRKLARQAYTARGWKDTWARDTFEGLHGFGKPSRAHRIFIDILFIRIPWWGQTVRRRREREPFYAALTRMQAYIRKAIKADEAVIKAYDRCGTCVTYDRCAVRSIMMSPE